MQVTERFSRLPALLVLTAAMLPISASYAGSGTFDGGKHNFCASVRFNATPAELAKIKTAFTNGSQILSDATDGQHSFGTIRLVNDSGASQSAEYWINSGAGRAYATYGDYGVRGEHVNMFMASNFQATDGADGDAYTVAHEHIHHSYGAADEYSGPGGAAEDAPTPDTATLNFSLMDNYFTRGGRASGGAYTLNELCTAANHDPDQDTYQHSINGKSVWETISGHPKRSATAPAGLPVSAPPAAHVVTFEDAFGGLRSMLLIDRSGSMSIDQRLVFAKQGAGAFINFFRTGDGLGVASFSSGTSVDFALTTVTGDATRTAARSAVDSLNAGGTTNIGGGLLTALGQITGQATRSCDELIILLSDGDHNTGTSPAAALPAVKAAGVTVLTVGVGSGISAAGQSTLQDIASQTGGKYYAVANSAGLVGLFFQLFAESTGQGLLARAPEAVGVGESKEIPVPVEIGTENVTFAMTFPNAADMLTVSLITPTGAVITPADAAGNPAIEYVEEANSKAFRITGPLAGLWKVVVTGGASVPTGTFEVLAFATHAGVQLNVSLVKDTLVFPEVAQIRATPRFNGESVVGATVVGTVERPDGSFVPVTLFDDGMAANGDGVAGDGIYSARFDDYKGVGTYTFELKVTSTTAKTFAGESLFASEPSNEKVLPAFTRVASATAVVTGVPLVVAKTLEENLACARDGINALMQPVITGPAQKSLMVNMLNVADRYRTTFKSLSISAVNTVIARTDGCMKNGTPDTIAAGGAEMDFITTCPAQAPINMCLDDAKTQLQGP